MSGAPTILVLGVGNILWADEGFGVRCAEALAAHYELPENVNVVDGGTQGLYLVDLFRTHTHAIIFDAIDYGDGPGVMREVRNGDIPNFVASGKVSLHQASMQEVIACAKLLGGCAEEMLLIGVQPCELEDYGGSLRPEVRDQIPVALDKAVAQIAEWGVALKRRDQAVVAAEVNDPSLQIAAYEAGRPDEAAACRVGDDRVLAQLAAR